MAESYKAKKEDFVSNLSGGDIWEIDVVTLVAPAAVLLWSSLQARRNIFVGHGYVALAVDILLNVGGILSVMTIYSDQPIVLNLLLISPAVMLFMLSHASQQREYKPPKTRKEATNHDDEDQNLSDFPIRPFITSYRGAMMVVTCLAILAVDFRIFPRRFAKVETWGTSLMDIGVGSFVFSAGTVGVRSSLREQATARKTGMPSRLGQALRHSGPLLVLGFIRLYSVKGLEYAEHVTEYGVHWNFFFTLALLPPFVVVSQLLFSLVPSYSVLAILLSVAYEAALELTNLKAYILAAPRKDLLSQNREGIFSFCGYLAIYLAGQGCGQYVLPRQQISYRQSSPYEQRKGLVISLGYLALIWRILLFITTSYTYGFGLQISRRLANLPYVIWVSSFNCSQILLFCLIETFCFPATFAAKSPATESRETRRATSKVLHAFNKNGLAVFLIANLLTGLVNMTIDTIAQTHISSIAILSGYALVLSMVTLLLDHYNVSIKL
ncbi:Glucosaminyl phosphatidylinositol (GlcN-PI) nositol acylation protein [Agyrium rufum]|nr:Glucosaminyl phosphatidylinositol (GlcN-PI) nositol acylation protein [Agyrium rufum]